MVCECVHEHSSSESEQIRANKRKLQQLLNPRVEYNFFSKVLKNFPNKNGTF